MLLPTYSILSSMCQVSGKYDPSNYIYLMVFVTSRGRFLTAGHPHQVCLPDSFCCIEYYSHIKKHTHSYQYNNCCNQYNFICLLQVSFNFYPTLPDAELMLLSGRFNSAGITSLGAHWGYAGINPEEIKPEQH